MIGLNHETKYVQSTSSKKSFKSMFVHVSVFYQKPRNFKILKLFAYISQLKFQLLSLCLWLTWLKCQTARTQILYGQSDLILVM